MKKAIIVARCSKSELQQDVTRQTEELNTNYSTQYEIIEKIEYYESGLKNDDKNKEILASCLAKEIDTIIFSEVSRISRRMIKALQFIEDCSNHKINIIIDAQKLHTLNDDKTENEISKMLLGLLSSFAEMELKSTQRRLNSGRKKYIADGGTLGRSKGTKEDVSKTLLKHKDIVNLLDKVDRGVEKQSIKKIATLCGGKSTATVMKVKKLWEANGKKKV